MREELLALDVTRIDLVTAGPAPAGARGGDALAPGALLVSLAASSGLLRAMVDAVASWVARPGQRSARLELDGDVLEVTGVSPREQHRLIQTWIDRHTTAVSDDAGGKAALLIAAAAYDDPKLSRLRAPVHDLDALVRVLADPVVGEFDVRTLLDQPSWRVCEQIEGFFADRDRDDLLLVYFSCHGVKDQTGRLHFAVTNTRVDRLSSTAISAAWVNEQLDRSRSQRIIVLLDCCYSGAYARGLAPRADDHVHVVEGLERRGRAVITASDAMEYAYEGDELSLDAGQPSLFTRAVVEGLETGQADRDGDGWVSIEELYAYVYDQVRGATSHQTPTWSAHRLQGELVLARNPHPPPPPIEPAPLPFELRQAVDSELAWQRHGAIIGLRRLLAHDRPEVALSATQTLQRLTSDGDPDVRAAATAAMQPASTPGTPVRPTQPPPRQV